MNVIEDERLYPWLVDHCDDTDYINAEHALHCGLQSGAIETTADVPRLGVGRIDHIEHDVDRRRFTFHDRGVDLGAQPLDDSYAIQG